MKQLFDKKVLSWAFYDWANSAYATIVLTVFFPLVFSNYWFTETGSENSTAPLGIANAVASLLIVAMAPVLGAIADKGGKKKLFLFFFLFIGVTFVSSLYFVAQGEWLLALCIYALAGIGFSGANIFYDALLVDIAKTDNFDSVSAFGYSLGYLGGGLALVIAIVFTVTPATFGFDNVSEAMTASFLLVGVWWALFSIPLFRNTPEAEVENTLSFSRAVTGGFGQLLATFKEIRKLRVVFLFLLAYWFYIDGVATMIRMSMNYGVRMGFDQMSLVQALLLTQFVGFPAAIIYGKLGEKYGTKLGLYVAIGVYMCVTGYAYFMDREIEFYVLAIVIGLVQGGIQSLSRSFYARLIPQSKAAEFFGFFNMMGKFAAVLGPLLMAAVSSASADPRLSILAVLVLFAIGAVLLFMVDEKEGQRIAEEME